LAELEKKGKWLLEEPRYKCSREGTKNGKTLSEKQVATNLLPAVEGSERAIRTVVHEKKGKRAHEHTQTAKRAKKPKESGGAGQI